jgi:GT2 family glycosyltransferase
VAPIRVRALSTAVIVVAYASGGALGRCLDSLAGEDVIVVNNGPAGPEIDDAARRARVIESGGNLGFGAGCNRGARETDADVLVFVNPDTVVLPGTIDAFAHALAPADVGIVQARLRLLDEPELLNSSGNVVHVSGLAWPGGYRDRADTVTEPREIPYASGAAFAIRAETFRELGGFTEELFLYQEDFELSWRAHLRGLRVLVVPGADVLHDYVLERPGRQKEYYLERNRLLVVLSAYSARLLFLLAPVLLAVELGILVLAARQGWLREKLRAWGWLLRNGPWLGEHRRRTQELRRVGDREVARFLTPVLDPRMLELPPGVAALNSLVTIWWRGVRVFL